jgi:hypothetical protein
VADDARNVTIEPGSACSLTRAAATAGETVDAFVNGLLESQAFGPTDWAEIDRICDGAAETGIRWEEFEPRLRGLGRRESPSE